MSLRLPASVEVRASGSVARQVGKSLRRSRRILRDKDGFSISIEGNGDALSVCLRSTLGSTLSCTEAQRPVPEGDAPSMTDSQYIRHVVAQFHDRAFAMPLGLSSIDLNSLDGTTTVSDEAERERMKQILSEVE
jgi:hypothetical protein